MSFVFSSVVLLSGFSSSILFFEFDFEHIYFYLIAGSLVVMGKKGQSDSNPSNMITLESIKKTWERAKKLFDYKKIDEGIADIAQGGDFSLALWILLLAGFISLVIAFATEIEAFYIGNFTAETVSQISGIAPVKLTVDSLVPLGIFQFVLSVPMNIILTIVFELLAFGIIKATGGEGKFKDQMYAASVITLSLAFATVLGLFNPRASLLCIQLVASGALIVLSIYFTFFVTVKAYSIIHKITFIHALIIAVLVTIPKIVALTLLTNGVAVALGLPPPITIPGV